MGDTRAIHPPAQPGSRPRKHDVREVLDKGLSPLVELHHCPWIIMLQQVVVRVQVRLLRGPKSI